jgi:protein ImuA
MRISNLSNSEFIEFLPNLFLKRGKIHQITGSARFTLALIIGRVIKEGITWIRQENSDEIIYPDGFVDWVTPTKLLFINAQREKESLWVMEEFLKSGVSSLVLCQLKKLPQYINLRRLVLHAKTVTGETEGLILPTGIILSDFQYPINGVESRWNIEPCSGSMTFSLKNNFFVEEKWSLTCNKSRIVESSWVIKSKKFFNGTRTVELH